MGNSKLGMTPALSPPVNGGGDARQLEKVGAIGAGPARLRFFCGFSNRAGGCVEWNDREKVGAIGTVARIRSAKPGIGTE